MWVKIRESYYSKDIVDTAAFVDVVVAVVVARRSLQLPPMSDSIDPPQHPLLTKQRLLLQPVLTVTLLYFQQKKLN